jgi:hypothetical protein
MDAPTRGSGPRLPLLALTLAVACVLLSSSVASALGGDWSRPKRVFTAPTVPSHDMTTDGSGTVHIASERGTGGIWYITNAGGTWTACQVSDGDDRWPSIAVDGGNVHIAFARLNDGAQGIYTASSDQPAGGTGCGWAITEHHAGSASHPSMQARTGSISIAFRTGDRKLRFMRGQADTADWTLREVVDASCCTSPVSLALTNNGAARVAYGDGASRAQGLKFAVRTGSGWRSSRAHGGRVKHVAMVLDQMPGLFGQPPSNAPHIAYVVARQGTFVVSKANDNPGGSWSRRSLGKAFGPLDLTHTSNVTRIVYTKGGDLLHTRFSGGIWVDSRLSSSGREGQPQLSGGQLTFTRKGTPNGIYSSHGG